MPATGRASDGPSAFGIWVEEAAAASLCGALARRHPERAAVMQRMASVKAAHASFWDGVRPGGGRQRSLPYGARARVLAWRLVSFLFGYAAVSKYLGVAQSDSVRRYARLLDDAGMSGHGDALKSMVVEELELQRALEGRRDSVEDVRNMVYGMVDALIEVLAVVVGLASALASPGIVALAGVVAASAGTVSMAAGAYLSSSSQMELVRGRMEEVEVRAKFEPAEASARVADRLRELGLSEGAAEGVGREASSDPSLAARLEALFHPVADEGGADAPKRAAWHAALYYAVGAMAPVLPFAMMIRGTAGIAIAVALSVGVLSVASALMAKLSGVSVRTKVLKMDAVALGAAAGTFLIGYVARTALGVG
ncbi:MAG: VIT1/CCC1 transporter family protein [Nitrososphaerota archaeon]|nr:VIT1/CCC1 transporter family protein [Nitrososphaerota archaeon]MDG6939586.1 VIT1/CCC1 transporter family protein [Nitrososphaerota archaeon]